jgi:hypothetical protein
MRRARLLAGSLVAAILCVTASQAFAQGLNNQQSLYLLYNQMNNQRATNNLQQQQNTLQRQFNQFQQGQQNGRVPYGYQDPVENYVRQIESGANPTGINPYRQQQYTPRIYGGGIRRSGTFQQQYRYFNPQRSPLY